MPTDASHLAQLGAALATESRAASLCALMGGTAHTNGELARHLDLAASTVSEHVGVLVDAGLVTMHAQGRHRYVGIADARTAELIEHLGVLSTWSVPSPASPVPAALVFARSCYRHLAGRLGVAIHDRLVERGALIHRDGALTIGSGHAELFSALGVSDPTAGLVGPGEDSRTPIARSCMDWSERRPHLSGTLGEQLLSSFVANGWLRRRAAQPRQLHLTSRGRQALADALDIRVSTDGVVSRGCDGPSA